MSDTVNGAVGPEKPKKSRFNEDDEYLIFGSKALRPSKYTILQGVPD